MREPNLPRLPRLGSVSTDVRLVPVAKIRQLDRLLLALVTFQVIQLLVTLRLLSHGAGQ